MTITLTTALLHSNGSYVCAITRDGKPELLHAVPGIDNAPDNDEVMKLVKSAFVEPYSLERFRKMMTSIDPAMVFSIEKDRADAVAELSARIKTMRKAIARDPVRYKVAHAALNGDTTAQEKIKSEADFRGLSWSDVANEIVRDETAEEKASFAISGIAAASKAAIDAATTVDGVFAVRDEYCKKLSEVTR